MVNKIKKILFCSAAFEVVFSFIPGTNFVWAAYPEKTIRLIVAAPPGGSADVIGRIVARYVSPFLGAAQVFVDNVSGASNAIGYRKGGSSTPDGYTLMLLNTAIVIGPHTTKGYPTYDLFDAVCVLTLETRLIVTAWNSSFKTIGDVISFAKANPGKLTVGTDGFGTSAYMGLMAFSVATGTTYTHVPYAGSGPAILAALGGHLDLSLSSSSALKPHFDSKKMRPLVTFGRKRYDIYPSAPTAKELGYDAEVLSFNGIGVPKNTPKDVIEVLAKALKKATEDPEYGKLVANMGSENNFMGPEVAGPWIKVQDAFYKGLALKIGMKPEVGGAGDDTPAR